MFKRIFALALVGVLVFSFSSAFAEGMENKKHRHMMQEKKEKMRAKADELTQELNLTPEQQTKIKEIRQRTRDEAKAILEEAKAKIRQIRIKANEQIKVLLTEEQKAKFKGLRKKSETPVCLKEE